MINFFQGENSRCAAVYRRNYVVPDYAKRTPVIERIGLEDVRI